MTKKILLFALATLILAVAINLSTPKALASNVSVDNTEASRPCKGFSNTAIMPRWCPCKAIRYSIDPTYGPGWEQDIHDAFRMASYYSKIPVVYAGKWPHGRTHYDDGDPVLVYYKGDTDGASAYTEPYVENKTIKGGVVMLSSWLALNRNKHKRAIYHEVGHVFGIPHPNPLSYDAVMGYGYPPYKAYDIYGFALFGKQSRDCV